MKILPAAECTHETLNFGSGDFYVFCHACGRSWAMISRSMDRIAPEEANQGAGSQLSGQERVAPMLTAKTTTEVH